MTRRALLLLLLAAGCRTYADECFLPESASTPVDASFDDSDAGLEVWQPEEARPRVIPVGHGEVKTEKERKL